MEPAFCSTEELVGILGLTGKDIIMRDLTLQREKIRDPDHQCDYWAVRVNIQKLIVEDKTFDVKALDAQITLGQWKCMSQTSRWDKLYRKVQGKVASAELEMKVYVDRIDNQQHRLVFNVTSPGCKVLHAWTQCVWSSRAVVWEYDLPRNQSHRLASSIGPNVPQWDVRFLHA